MSLKVVVVNQFAILGIRWLLIKFLTLFWPFSISFTNNDLQEMVKKTYNAKMNHENESLANLFCFEVEWSSTRSYPQILNEWYSFFNMYHRDKIESWKTGVVFGVVGDIFSMEYICIPRWMCFLHSVRLIRTRPILSFCACV